MFDQVTSSAVASLSSISADIFVSIAVVILFVALAMARGKDRVLAFLIALYPAALITAYFPYYDLVAVGRSQYITVLTVFFVVALAIYAVLRKYIEASYQHHGFWRLLEYVLLAAITTGLLFALLYHVVSIEQLHDFSVILDSLFGSSLALFTWLVVPFVAIPLFVRP